ncbi:tRNA-specific adenosine-34 deaminase subunit TAD2 [Hyphodiscus hymeniophilus]|uniref:tRNA-specific adenosine-34 deaminase subunit TAD2 n=1 Tax=Hyphodiscus hymeniophilus TaxID=353542 RepID=A0A9P6VMJ8_9HELO|nr:tRNA-specific adenosine-34 deaminase subunit TAD2 [Hyphodiscus hymeniophilus]
MELPNRQLLRPDYRSGYLDLIFRYILSLLPKPGKLFNHSNDSITMSSTTPPDLSLSTPSKEYPLPAMSETEEEAATAQHPEATDRREKTTHLNFMRQALAMAERALDTNETPVGCVFVHKGAVIGRGMNATNRSYNGTRHAEFMAISSILSEPAPVSPPAPDGCGPDGAGDRHALGGEARGRGKKYSPDVLMECDLYVTVEPCIMCASLLRQVGVRRVFFGAGNEKFGGTGGVLNVHRGNGKIVLDESGADGGRRREESDYEVSGGWLRDEAILMLQRFYMQENDRAPEPKARGKKGVVLAGVEVDVEVDLPDPVRDDEDDDLSDGGHGTES